MTYTFTIFCDQTYDRLDAREREIYLHICRWSSHLVFSQSLGQIEQTTGIPLSKVRRTIKKLCEINALEVVAQGSAQQATEYRVVIQGLSKSDTGEAAQEVSTSERRGKNNTTYYVPEDWYPSSNLMGWCMKQGYSRAQVDQQVAVFVDWYRRKEIKTSPAAWPSAFKKFMNKVEPEATGRTEAQGYVF
jgi:hypothetical protein